MYVQIHIKTTHHFNNKMNIFVKHGYVDKLIL